MHHYSIREKQRKNNFKYSNESIFIECFSGLENFFFQVKSVASGHDRLTLHLDRSNETKNIFSVEVSFEEYYRN